MHTAGRGGLSTDTVSPQGVNSSRAAQGAGRTDTGQAARMPRLRLIECCGAGATAGGLRVHAHGRERAVAHNRIVSDARRRRGAKGWRAAQSESRPTSIADTRLQIGDAIAIRQARASSAMAICRQNRRNSPAVNVALQDSLDFCGDG